MLRLIPGYLQFNDQNSGFLAELNGNIFSKQGF